MRMLHFIALMLLGYALSATSVLGAPPQVTVSPPSFPQGYPVTFRGDGFDPGASYRFELIEPSGKVNFTDSVLSSEISPDGTLRIDGGSDPTDPIGQWILHILDANGKVVASAPFTLTDRSAVGTLTPPASATAPAATVAPKATGTGGATVPTTLPTTGHRVEYGNTAMVPLIVAGGIIVLGIILRRGGRLDKEVTQR